MKSAPITASNQALLRDESRMIGAAKEVITPECGEEVAQCVRQTLQAGEKLTIRGSGTGLNGGCVPRGGRVLDLSRLNHMGEIEGEKLWVEAGVTLEDVTRKAAAAQLRFPPNPTEQNATLGGLFATGGAGPSSLCFGPSSRFVTGLEWVSPTGACWHIRRGETCVTHGTLTLPDGVELKLEHLDALPIRGFEEGMDLIDCLAGTEGYFGVAVSMELSLLPLPADLWGVVFFFDDSTQAVEFGGKLERWTAGDGIRLAAAEFYNREALELMEQSRENPLLSQLPSFPEGAGAALYVEMEGEDPDLTADALMELLDLFDGCGGNEEHTWAENGPVAVKKFRDMRHAVPSILNEMRERYPKEGSRYEGDFGGKGAHFPMFLTLYETMLEKYHLRGAVYGNLLENKLRLALLPETAQQLDCCCDLMYDLAEQVVELGGTLNCEYDVGRLKLDLVKQLLPPQKRERLQAVLRAVDPARMMERQ